ncbi:pH response protein PalF [Aspergillus luchuensis]|uniref:pH response protein PalF n=1 Tax=Aspergillus kawachii TaxID=1069201 RepID=A0A146FM92_ASPKA|nr:pH response protein PalF [Aspergillus luchuensis]
MAAKTQLETFIVSVPDQMRSTAIRGARRVRERAGLVPGAGLSGKLDRSPGLPVLMPGDGEPRTFHTLVIRED